MLPYSSDDRRCPPPRAPFSSSLSPSAAPFPAADPAAPGPGRDLPTAPSVYAAGGEWGTASWMEPPVSYMAPTAAAVAPPPGYKGEASHSAPYGIYLGSHFSNFVGLHSLRSESSNSISEKHPGTYRESSEALSNGLEQSFFYQPQNASASKFLDHSGAEDTLPYPSREDLNQYPFGSAYEKYMTQLSSCSTDRQPHILSTKYVDSSEMAKSTVPVMNDTIGESSFSFSSSMNPCRINLDYFDCVWNEQKDHGYQSNDKQHGKWSSSVHNMAAMGNYPLGENRLGTECLENGRPMQESSESKHDLGSSISKFSSSEVGFVQPREFSSELLEVNNTTVDSPCWKGTPATYQPSFGIMENNNAPHTVIGTVGYNSSHQSQMAPELGFDFPGRFPEHDEASGSKNSPLKTFKFPVIWKTEVTPIDARVHNNMATHASYLPDKQLAQTQKCYDCGEDSKNVVASSQQDSSLPASKPKLLCEHSGSHTAIRTEVINTKVMSPIAITCRGHVDNLTSGSTHGNSSSAATEKEQRTGKRGEDPSQRYPGAEGNILNMSCDSSSSTRAIFLKLMHNLSVVLLSTCKGSLQEDEEELLQSVIQNLTSAGNKRSKVEQKIDDGLSNSSQMEFKSINCARNKYWMATPENSAPENAESEFKTTVSQVLNKLPEDQMLDDTEFSQASIYKKLWIEAEASACKLKYELQLARMKLAATKGHSNTLKVLDSSEGSKGSNSSISSSKPQNHGKEGITCVAALQCQGGDRVDRQSPVVNRSIVDGVDADVFARLKVLQSRVDNACSSGEIDHEGQQEASKKSYVVEDAVMARLRILESRTDNITSSSQESIKQQLDSSTNRADNVDDAVMARLRILESRPNFLGQESSKQQLDASTGREDGIDDAVMARLRILKSRPDNITSMGGVSKEHEEACSDPLNGDEVGIRSAGGIIKIKRVVKQLPKFQNSDDLADRFEREDSVADLNFTDGSCVAENNEAGGSADVATPKRCKAPSDEVNNKVENHVCPQTAGDSHVCTEGSQETHSISSPVHQYDSLPSEWEHVLKENFFHPGK